MASPSLRISDWALSRESLQRFLATLDPDQQRAAACYELLRRKLQKFFQWHNDAFADEHVDETFDRVSRKLERGERVNNISSYCYGVARMMLKEIDRQASKERSAIDGVKALEAADDDEARAQRSCLDKCLRALEAANRSLILSYYVGEGQRKIRRRRALADELAISADALRIRAHRLRAKLEECVEGCIREDSL